MKIASKRRNKKKKRFALRCQHRVPSTFLFLLKLFFSKDVSNLEKDHPSEESDRNSAAVFFFGAFVFPDALCALSKPNQSVAAFEAWHIISTQTSY